ncbi:N-6 DNA methylase [Amycolatopsis sp. lyj-23]|uniref:N-6 DNA methylase n=1 Tax=Amycolatopsis sp. lyj-23 TaxID=2789283 RepID=UPI003978D2D6
MNDRKHRADQGSANTPINAEAHALTLAVEVASAWHRGGGADQSEVPLGIVATIAAAGLLVGRADDVAAGMLSAAPDGFVDIARSVWAVTLSRRPDLAQSVYPLLGWLFAANDQERRIKATADAALRIGQLKLTATERRFDCDVLGPVLGALRSRTATKVNAQMYTPGDIACALTAVALDDLKPGQSFCDVAVGTGGLFRAAACVVRSRGLNLADMSWFGADVDELAIAAAAVNSLIWSLGSKVFFYAGDVLAHPHWAEEACSRRARFLEEVDGLSSGLKALDFLRRL